MADSIRADVRFSILPEWLVFHPDLSSNAVRLYAALARHIDADGEAWPGRKGVSRRIGWSVDTFDRAMNELTRHGAVTKEARFNDAGDQTSNLYTLHVTPQDGLRAALLAPAEGAANLRPPGRNPAATPGRKSAAQTRASLEETPPTPQGGSERPFKSICKRHTTRPRRGCDDCLIPAPDQKPWCGDCDERTRLVDLPSGGVARCETCHPLSPPRPERPVDVRLPPGDRE